MSEDKEERVVLVDEQDNEMGSMEKLEAHEKGILHRAFSVFLFNSKQELLLQQRAAGKYHSPNLWTNTCCSHPRIGETLEAAVKRRMQEEMGMDCEATWRFSFIYNEAVEGDLVEHEFDHVFFAHGDLLPVPNEKEVSAFRYATLDEVSDEVVRHPERFTVWFKHCLPRVLEHGQVWLNKDEG